MEIDNAIFLKESYLRHPLNNMTQAEKEADKMSIEALKLVKLNQDMWGNTEAFNLPGETEK